MTESIRSSIVDAFGSNPNGCRYEPASEDQLHDFESSFGPIPADFRWFLAKCGGGVGGSAWVDGIVELEKTHRKFREEAASPRGWRMRDVFVIGWDGYGNPFGIDLHTGKIIVEDHDHGGIHELSPSFEKFLFDGLL